MLLPAPSLQRSRKCVEFLRSMMKLFWVGSGAECRQLLEAVEARLGIGPCAGHGVSRGKGSTISICFDIAIFFGYNFPGTFDNDNVNTFKSSIIFRCIAIDNLPIYQLSIKGRQFSQIIGKIQILTQIDAPESTKCCAEKCKDG